MNMETIDFVSQAWMVIFGCAAIWLFGWPKEWRRWGYMAGPISQPAFLFRAFTIPSAG